jgi:hypothetical protein
MDKIEHRPLTMAVEGHDAHGFGLSQYFRRYYACTSWKPLKEDKAKLMNVQKVRSARVLGDLFSNRKDTRVSLDMAGVKGVIAQWDPHWNFNLLGVDALPRPTCNSIIHLTL